MSKSDQYTVLRHIGKGNMGACVLARRISDGLTCVLKDVSLANLSRREREQALTEARVLWSSTHPNIVRYIDSWVTSDDHLVIAMEYAPDGDLRAHIENRRGKHIREDKVLDWFIQICFAVRSLERRCIMHRDLKTQNILISDDGIAKVADFGISKVQKSSNDLCGTFVGTPYYLSPEVVKKEPYGLPSDMWSLGVVLAEMLTVSHPFTGRNADELSANILRGTYTQPSSRYSQEIREIVDRLLQQNPRKRLTPKGVLGSQLVRARLEAWCSQEGLVPVHYLSRLLRRGSLTGLVSAAALAQAEARTGTAAATATTVAPSTVAAAPRPPSAPRPSARSRPHPPPPRSSAKPLLRQPPPNPPPSGTQQLLGTARMPQSARRPSALHLHVAEGRRCSTPRDIVKADERVGQRLPVISHGRPFAP